MRKLLAIIIVLLLVAGGVWYLAGPYLGKSETVRPLVDLAPADVLMSMEVRAPYAVWQRHPARPFFEEVLRIDWVGELGAFLRPEDRENLQLADESFKRAQGLLKRVPMADLFGEELIAYARPGAGEPGLNLLTRLGEVDGERAWKTLLEVLGEMPQRYPWITGGADGNGATLHLAQHPGREVSLHCRRVGNVVWFGNDLGEVDRLTRALDPESEEPSLAEVEEYLTLTRTAGVAEADIRYYVSAARVELAVTKMEELLGVASFMGQMMKSRDSSGGGVWGEEDPDALPEDEALGPFGMFGGLTPGDPRADLAAGALQAAAPLVERFILEPARARRGSMRAGRVSEAALEMVHVESVVPESRVATEAASAMRRNEFVKRIPSDAQGFSFRSDLGMAATYRAVIDALEGSESGKAVVAGLRDWEREHDLPIEETFFAWQSGEVISVTIPGGENRSGLTPGGQRLWLLGARDEAVARASIARIVDFAETTFELYREERDGVTVLGLQHLVTLPGIGGALAMTVRDGYAVLAVGSEPEAAIARVFDSKDDDVFAGPKWRGMEALLEDRALSYSFSDTGRMWTSIAGLGKMLPLVQLMVGMQISDDAQREQMQQVFSLLQGVLPVFEELAVLDAMGSVKSYRDGCFITRTRVNVKAPEPPARVSAADGGRGVRGAGQ